MGNATQNVNWSEAFGAVEYFLENNFGYVSCRFKFCDLEKISEMKFENYGPHPQLQDAG
jgi:hypothetical protein